MNEAICVSVAVSDQSRGLRKPFLWLALVLLVAVHMALLITNVAAFFVLPFQAPWYVAWPLMTFIWFFSTTRVQCRLTELENHLRRSLGLRLIGGFVGHYLLRPLRRLLGLRQRRTRVVATHTWVVTESGGS